MEVSKIHALGKRARERLDEERKKRKTIQVLHEDIATRDATTKLTPKRRSRRSVSATSVQQQQQPPLLSISSIVRLYVVGVASSSSSSGTDISYITPDLIRKFFIGLDDEIERIFAIPFYPALVQPLDDPVAMQLQLQQDGCWLRIFVQFTSSTVADLAAQRSQESITWRTSAGGEGQQQQQHKVRIIVHPIDLTDSNAANTSSTTVILSQKMSIDTIQGEPILTTVQRFHASLPPFVSNCLVWFMAASLLHLSHYNKGKKTMDIIYNISSIDEEEKENDCNSSPRMYSALSLVNEYVWGEATTTRTTTTPAANSSRERYLISLYNALWDCHAELERTCSPLLLVSNSFSTNKIENPIVRAVQSISNWLLDELEKKHIQIMQYRFHLPSDRA
jgi:hypothetical protein